MIKYQIIRDIAVIKDNGFETLKLKYIKWDNNSPKYDLGRWKNGSPLKGVTLSEEEANELTYVLGKELGFIGDEIVDDDDVGWDNTEDDEDEDNEKDEDNNDDNDDDEADGEETYTDQAKNERIIDYRSFFVRKTMDECDREGHEYTSVTAKVPMLADDSYKEIEFPAMYCFDCNVFYVTYGR